jgi:diacylglycerol kinase family enzyme
VAPPVAAGGRRRLLLVVNPHASGTSARARERVAGDLAGPFAVEVVETRAPGDAVELARRAAADGIDVVATLGGDGTANEAANGLAGGATALAPLPGGATNVLARLLGAPRDLAEATHRLAQTTAEGSPPPRRIDLGRVNGRAFTFSGGIGLVAAIVRRADERPRLKARLRQWCFAASALEVLGREFLVDPPRMEVEVDGRTIPGVTLVVQNADVLTFFADHPLRVADGARLDGGTLAGAVLRRAAPLDVPAIALRLFTRAPVAAHPHVEPFGGVRALRCVASDGRPLPLEVDGEHLGEVREARYELLPGALAVLA